MSCRISPMPNSWAISFLTCRRILVFQNADPSVCRFSLIDLFIDIIGFSITLLFLWTFASVCCGLLTLEFGFVKFLFVNLSKKIPNFRLGICSISQSDEHLNNIELIRIVFLVLASFVVIGIACEFSARLTNQFETICDALLQCNWYLYPIKLQKMLIMVIVNVQQPVQVAGFGNMKCSRDSFKQVQFCIEKQKMAV